MQVHAQRGRLGVVQILAWRIEAECDQFGSLQAEYAKRLRPAPVIYIRGHFAALPTAVLAHVEHTVDGEALGQLVGVSTVGRPGIASNRISDLLAYGGFPRFHRLTLGPTGPIAVWFG